MTKFRNILTEEYYDIANLCDVSTIDFLCHDIKRTKLHITLKLLDQDLKLYSFLTELAHLDFMF